MPSGLPHRPPLAMKLWLSKRFGRPDGTHSSTATQGHASGIAMSMGSLDHMVRSRVRMFLRHTWLVTFLGTVAVGGLLWAGFYVSTRATVMRIAAGPADSASVKFVQTLAQKLVTDRDRLEVQFVATSGPKDSAQAMTDGRADLAVLPSTIGNSPDWPVVAILRQNVMTLIVPAPAAGAPETKAAPETKTPETKTKTSKDTKAAKNTKSAKGAKSGKSSKDAKHDDSAKSAKSDKGDDSDDDSTSGKLAKVSQLTGHRVGIVTGNEATTDLLDVVLNHYGVALGQVQISLIDPKNLADAIHANQVDALFVAGAATGKAISDAVAAAAQNGVAPTFIEIDQADGIAKRNPAFDSIDIDAGTFGGNPPSPDDSIKSLSFAEYLVARKSFSHNSIATLARIIYASRLALAAAMPGEVKIEAPSTDKDANVSVHPGALAYLTDDQKSFFDKYGDDIFYGLLIFPIFGSAIAAVAGYLRSDGRTRRLRLLQRLLDIVRKAHAAQSLEAIDQLQIETDNALVAIIHQSEHEEPDPAVQMSYSMALEQVRFALAARRAVLIEHGTAGTKAAAA